MKQIAYLFSMIAFTAIIGLGVTVPVNAGKQTVATQTSSGSGNGMVRRSGCRHPDHSKCRRPVHRQVQAKQQLLEVRPERSRPYRGGCRHPDRSKCRRRIYQSAQ